MKGRFIPLVFTTGAAILALEMVASRFMTPAFGTSVFIWGSVLSVTLISMAFGYVWGGTIGDRHPEPARRLTVHLLISGGYLATLSALGPAVLRLGAAAGGWLGPIVTAALLLVVPLLLLSTTVPVVIGIRLRADGEGNARATMAGRLFAASTAGSVFGALITAYVAIPYLGVRRSLLAVAAVVLATCLRPMWKGIARRLGIGVIALGILAHSMPGRYVGAATFSRGVTVLYSADTRYAHVDVVEDRRDRSRALLIDGSSQNWATGPDWEQSLFDYVPALWRHLERFDVKEKRALVLGLGAGTLVRQLAGGGFRVDVAEIDPVVAELARQFFAFDPAVAEVRVEDARAMLERLAGGDARYGLIVFDVAGTTYHPDHVYNLEAYRLARDLLASGGIVVLNMVGVPDGRIIEHTGATFARVLAHTEAFELSPDARDPVSTVLFVGSDSAPKTPAPVRPDERALVLRRELRALSDDWNPTMVWAVNITEAWRENNRAWLGDAAVIPVVTPRIVRPLASGRIRGRYQPL